MSKFDFAGAVNKQLATLRDGTAYSVAKLNKEAGLIKTAAQKMDVRYHAAAIAGLGVVMDHNDTSGMKALLNAVGRAVRAKALSEWFMRYSHVECTLDKKAGSWAVKLLDKDDRYDRTGLEDLMAAAIDDPFWTPEEKTAADFSLSAAIAQLLKKAEGAKSKGKLSQDEVLALAELQGIADKVKPAAAPIPAVANDEQDELEKVG